MDFPHQSVHSIPSSNWKVKINIEEHQMGQMALVSRWRGGYAFEGWNGWTAPWQLRVTAPA
jgi:hypothetical protein